MINTGHQDFKCKIYLMLLPYFKLQTLSIFSKQRRWLPLFLKNDYRNRNQQGLIPEPLWESQTQGRRKWEHIPLLVTLSWRQKPPTMEKWRNRDSMWVYRGPRTQRERTRRFLFNASCLIFFYYYVQRFFYTKKLNAVLIKCVASIGGSSKSEDFVRNKCKLFWVFLILWNCWFFVSAMKSYSLTVSR